MFNVDKITEIFCIVDDFCIEFDKVKNGHVLDKDNSKKRRNRSFKLSDSEVQKYQTLLYQLCNGTSSKRVSSNCFL